MSVVAQDLEAADSKPGLGGFKRTWRGHLVGVGAMKQESRGVGVSRSFLGRGLWEREREQELNGKECRSRKSGEKLEKSGSPGWHDGRRFRYFVLW